MASPSKIVGVALVVGVTAFAFLAPPRSSAPSSTYDSSIAARTRCQPATIEKATLLAQEKKWGDAILLLDGCIGPYELPSTKDLRDRFRADREIDWLEKNPKGAWDVRLNALRTVRAHAPDKFSKPYEAEYNKLERRDEIEREKAAKTAAAQERNRRKREGVSIGMSKEEVLMSNWGKPDHINTDVYATGTREQWVYGGGYLYFRDGTLTSIQTRNR